MGRALYGKYGTYGPYKPTKIKPTPGQVWRQQHQQQNIRMKQKAQQFAKMWDRRVRVRQLQKVGKPLTGLALAGTLGGILGHLVNQTKKKKKQKGGKTPKMIPKSTLFRPPVTRLRYQHHVFEHGPNYSGFRQLGPSRLKNDTTFNPRDFISQKPKKKKNRFFKK